MRILIFLAFLFLPTYAFASLTVSVDRSTHALGFDVLLTNASSSSEVRIFPPYSTGPRDNTRGSACAWFVSPTYNWNTIASTALLQIRPSAFPNAHYVGTSATLAQYNYYCFSSGVHTVALFSGPTSTSTISSDTIYLEQYPLDFRSVFMLIFIVGALLAILRPIIKTLTLK